ncbi:MAG: energy transducer TonB [Pseudomonadota bacterium]
MRYSLSLWTVSAALLSLGTPAFGAPLEPDDSPPLPANRKPKPIDPDAWIAPSVIEARACRGERCFVGFVGYTLLINVEGRPTDCAVTRSSGDPALDVETCNLLLRHARFQSATNSKGKPTRGRYASGVTWTGRSHSKGPPD